MAISVRSPEERWLRFKASLMRVLMFANRAPRLSGTVRDSAIRICRYLLRTSYNKSKTRDSRELALGFPQRGVSRNQVLRSLITASQSRKITVTLGETCRPLLVIFPSLVRLLGEDSLKDN